MFYSHQLLARKAPLGQIWMAATTHAKINRRGLDKLNIIKICEEILNPSVPMALRLSGILMGGIVIVYERKVKLLYDDVTRLLLELNSAWKVKTVMDPTVLPKGKSQAKREAITLPDNEETNVEDVEQSLQFSNIATTVEFQRSAYFTMRLDSVDEPYICDGSREQDPSQHLHQADAANITLDDAYESFQANADPYYGFERFDIEGDEETQVNFGQNTEIPSTLIPSLPSQVDPTGADIIRDQQPGCDVVQQSDQCVEDRQEQVRRGLRTRKRKQPQTNAMDYEQTIIPVGLYQSWLQDTSDIVSRGRKRKRSEILSKAKIANLMELPPVVLNEDLFKNGNRDVHYPPPILELWYRSTQPPHDSPSERISIPPPPEPSFSSPGLHHEDSIGIHLEDFHNGRDSQLASAEKQRDNVHDNGIFIDELKANLDNGSMAPENTNQVTPRNSGDSVDYFPRSASEHGLSSNSDLHIERSKKKRISSSRNSSGGLEPVAENANFKLSRLSDNGLTPDQELIVETGRTQTQANINNPIDNMTDSIRTHIKAHFDAPGAPQVESLDILASGMTRKSAALLFYQTCVLVSQDALKVEQKEPYGEILISRGSKM